MASFFMLLSDLKFGELGLGEMYGRSSLSSSINESLDIRKFLYQSSSGAVPFSMLVHHCSVLPGNTQQRRLFLCSRRSLACFSFRKK